MDGWFGETASTSSSQIIDTHKVIAPIAGQSVDMIMQDTTNSDSSNSDQAQDGYWYQSHSDKSNCVISSDKKLLCNGEYLADDIYTKKII